MKRTRFCGRMDVIADSFMSTLIPSARSESLHGWSIPAQGKDYEVKDKDENGDFARYRGRGTDR